MACLLHRYYLSIEPGYEIRRKLFWAHEFCDGHLAVQFVFVSSLTRIDCDGSIADKSIDLSLAVYYEVKLTAAEHISIGLE